jgi:hypothetical protein
MNTCLGLGGWGWVSLYYINFNVYVCVGICIFNPQCFVAFPQTNHEMVSCYPTLAIAIVVRGCCCFFCNEWIGLDWIGLDYATTNFSSVIAEETS